MQSAMEQKCIKTTAPIPVFYDMLKHIKKTKFKELTYLPENLTAESFRYKILAREINLPKEPVYVRTSAKPGRLPRFFPNPEPNWGPKARAKGKKRAHAEEEQKGEEEKEGAEDEDEDEADQEMAHEEAEEIIKVAPKGENVREESDK